MKRNTSGSEAAYYALETRNFSRLRFTGTTTHNPGTVTGLKTTFADAVITYRGRHGVLVDEPVWVLLPFDTEVADVYGG